MLWQRAILCGVMCLVSGCFRQLSPSDKSGSVRTHPVVQESSAWVIVLDGYTEAAFRRVFQEQLRGQGLEVELLNSGAKHAEYQIYLSASTSPDWRQNLHRFLGEQYVMRQDGERLLFIRQ